MSYWIETKWQIPVSEREEFVARMVAWGCVGSAESVLSPEQSIALYFVDADLESLATRLRAWESESIRLVSCTRIAEENWANEWKKYFKPFMLAPGIVIRPSWEAYTTASEHVIVLDPGMAFGTGQHDSTRFCAEHLVEIRQRYPYVRSVVDVGCGSGILSLVAAALGFDSVMGIDNDPIAIQVAEENRARNPELMCVRFLECDDRLVTPEKIAADLIVANIIAETVCALKPFFLKLLKPNGLLILSGIIPERAAMIETGYRDFTILEKKQSAEWCSYLLKKD